MSKHAKLLGTILLGPSGANIPFDGLCALLERPAFLLRLCGSRRILKRS
jgi:hypothetical protein